MNVSKEHFHEHQYIVSHPVNRETDIFAFIQFAFKLSELFILAWLTIRWGYL